MLEPPTDKSSIKCAREVLTELITHMEKGGKFLESPKHGTVDDELSQEAQDARDELIS